MTPEKIFLRYAFPCLDTLCYELGKVDENIVKDIKDKVKSNTDVEKKDLENLFPAAIARIKDLAIEKNRTEYWTVENIRDYFIHHHNMIIDNGKGSYAILRPETKYWCKTRKAKIKKIDGKLIELIYEDHDPRFDTTRKFYNLYNLDLNEQDIVTTHYRFIIEKL